MSIEDELVVRVWEALLELAVYSTIRRANVVADGIPQHVVDVQHLGQLNRVEVSQQQCTLVLQCRYTSHPPQSRAVMEGSREEPEAV